MHNDHIVISYNTCWYVYMFRLSLIRALRQKGWRVTVLAPKDQYMGKVMETGAAHRHIDMDPKGTNPLRELAAIGKFVAAYRELSPAIVLQYTIKPDIYGSIAARLTGIPVINNVTGLGTMFSGGLKEMLVRGLYRFALSKAELTLFQNPDDHALFLKQGIVRPERDRAPSRVWCRLGALLTAASRRRSFHVPSGRATSPIKRRGRLSGRSARSEIQAR